MHKIILIGILLFGMNSFLNANDFDDRVMFSKAKRLCNKGDVSSCTELVSMYRQAGENTPKSLDFYKMACNKSNNKTCNILTEINEAYENDRSSKQKDKIIKIIMMILWTLAIFLLLWLLKKAYYSYGYILGNISKDGKKLLNDKHQEYNRHKAEDELLRAKKLYDNGIINKEEFEYRLKTNKRQLKYSQKNKQITDANTKQPIQQGSKTKKEEYKIKSLLNKILQAIGKLFVFIGGLGLLTSFMRYSNGENAAGLLLLVWGVIFIFLGKLVTYLVKRYLDDKQRER